MTILFESIVILAFAAMILFICHNLKIPSVVGFLLTGIVIGPHGFGIVPEIKHVEELAEIGIVLLLFTIGLEFSFKKLASLKFHALVGGSLQLIITVIIIIPFAIFLSKNFGSTIFLGFLVALSSTAIVLKILQQKAEIESPHGRLILAILIFQDIAVVPIMLFIPIFSGQTDNLLLTISLLTFKAILVALIVFLSVKIIIPKLLHYIVNTRNRELFMLSIVVLCFSIAWLTAKAGMSLALGAFLAGLIISESEYSHQAAANILPFKDVFTSFFFISIGMLINLNFMFHHIGSIILSVSGIILLKSLIIIGIVLLLGFPFRTAILTGLCLCQVGEFSFVLYKASMDYGLLTENLYQLFLSVSVVTMIMTPFIIGNSHKISDLIEKLPIPKKFKEKPVENKALEGLVGHLIIIGFGLNGRYLAKAAKIWKIPYIIIEANPETVRIEKAKGEPIFYGDAIYEAILEHANVSDAKLAVIAISDPVSVQRTTKAIRDINHKIHIIARTRFFSEYKTLIHLGANEVIPEDFETAMEIFSRVLSKYFVPRKEIENFISEIRSDGYEMSRNLMEVQTAICELKLPNVEIKRYKLGQDCNVCGKTLEQIGLRKNYNITLLSLRSQDNIISNPGANTILQAEDVIIVVGQTEHLTNADNLFSSIKNKM
ncbi:MAG: cation:proton antiporter [Desulfobacterales bacterium]|nr:cation:proton antiporter [Desulfobacterales bacterium]